MPYLIAVDTKENQSDDLQIVCETASEQNKSLEEEEERFNMKLHALIRSSCRVSIALTQ